MKGKVALGVVVVLLLVVVTGTAIAQSGIVGDTGWFEKIRMTIDSDMTPAILVTQSGDGPALQVVDSAGDVNFELWATGNFTTAGNIEVAVLDISDDLTILGDLNVGDGTPDGGAGILAGDEDLYVEGGVEVDGQIRADGGVDLNGADLVIDTDGDSILDENTDDAIRMTIGNANGYFAVATGNLRVGNGTPSVTQDGEDAYIEGSLEVDEIVYLGDYTEFSAGGMVFGADLDAAVGWAEASDSFAINVNTNCETGTACSVGVSTVTTGTLTLLNGSLFVGNGTPDNAQDGEDAYIEGQVEFDGTMYADGDIVLQAGNTITHEESTNSGIVFSCVGSHDHSSTEDAVTICVIPANADVIEATYVVTTQWNDGASAAVDCGISGGDTDAFVDAMNVNDAADLNRMGDAADMPYAATLIDVGATPATVVCQVAEGNNDATAGAATLYLLYRVEE